MRTDIFTPITTQKQAESFIKALHRNNELFHFEDDPSELIWNGCTEPTEEEKQALRERVSELFNVLKDPFELTMKLMHQELNTGGK